MNTRCQCLFAALLAVLLALPVAYADAGQVTINVPVEITNAPTGVTKVAVDCRVGLGPAPPGLDSIWPGVTERGSGAAYVTIPAAGSYRGVARVVVNARDGATHYKCFFGGYAGQPALHGQNAVSGPIPVTVMVTPR